MPLHLGPSAFPQAIRLSPVGFIITFLHLRVVMAVTALPRYWNDYSAVERMLLLFPKIGVSIVFTIGLIGLFVHFT